MAGEGFLFFPVCNCISSVGAVVEVDAVDDSVVGVASSVFRVVWSHLPPFFLVLSDVEGAVDALEIDESAGSTSAVWLFSSSSPVSMSTSQSNSLITGEPTSVVKSDEVDSVSDSDIVGWWQN